MTTCWQAPAFHDCLIEGEHASSPTGKGTGGLWSWPLWVQSLLSGLGRTQQQEGDARLLRSLMSLKCGTAISQWERRLPPPGTQSCNPCTGSRPSPRSWTSWRQVRSQRCKAIEVATQDGDWKRASYLELLLTAKGLFMGRGELELINGELRHEMPLIKFLDEGRAPWRKCCKGQEKGKHSDKRKGRPQRASPKENPAESKASSI